MLILDLWGISFHAVVVFALGKNLLFKSALGHCGMVMRVIQTTHTHQSGYTCLVFTGGNKFYAWMPPSRYFSQIISLNIFNVVKEVFNSDVYIWRIKVVFSQWLQ